MPKGCNLASSRTHEIDRIGYLCITCKQLPHFEVFAHFLPLWVDYMSFSRFYIKHFLFTVDDILLINCTASRIEKYILDKIMENLAIIIVCLALM